MIPNIDPRIDYAFKRLFAVERNSDILIDFLNSVLLPSSERQIIAVEILNPFNPKESDDEKLSIVDIKVRDQAGRIYVVEMQMLVFRDLPQRILFYWASAYREQLSPGEPYSNLRPTIVIAVLNENLFPLTTGHHTRFKLESNESGIGFTDDLEIHTIELPKFTREIGELNTSLDRWSYFLLNAATLDSERIPVQLAVPAIAHAIQELVMISQNELERQQYLSHQLAVMDQQARMRDSHLRGLWSGTIQTCQRILRKPVTAAEDLARMPFDDLRQLAEELEKDAFASTGSSNPK